MHETSGYPTQTCKESKIGGEETEIRDREKQRKPMRRGRKKEPNLRWQSKRGKKRKPSSMASTLGRKKEAHMKEKKISLERSDGGEIRAEPHPHHFQKARQRFPRRASREDFQQSRAAEGFRTNQIQRGQQQAGRAEGNQTREAARISAAAAGDHLIMATSSGMREMWMQD
jgi:hypothetical protein